MFSMTSRKVAPRNCAIHPPDAVGCRIPPKSSVLPRSCCVVRGSITRGAAMTPASEVSSEACRNRIMRASFRPAAACAREGLQTGTRAFAVCVVKAEQSQ